MLRNDDEIPQGSQAAIKQKYNDLCTSVYREIQSQGTVASVPGWAREYNQTYGITTWTLTENKDQGRVGSNGKLEVKIFDKGSYDFVKTEDFLTRGNLICDAAIKLIEKNAGNNDFKKNRLVDAVQEQRTAFTALIKTDCSLDPSKIRNNDAAHFNKQYRKAKNVMRQLLADTSINVLEAKKINNANAGTKEAIKEINAMEKNILTERGRPAVMKIGSIGEPGQELQMVSVQFPQGKETIISSERSGNYNTKLSNHVLDGSGILSTSNNQASIKFDVMVDGHSSYTPLTETEVLKRLQVGVEALKEKIAATASDIKNANPMLGTTANNPIKVSVSAMILMTPINALEKAVLRAESETKQVDESRMVIELLRNQKQPLELKGKDGKTIYAVYDPTYMNVPVNSTMKAQSVMSSEVQGNINARGFLDYIENMRSHLSQSLNALANDGQQNNNNRRDAVIYSAKGNSVQTMILLDNLINLPLQQSVKTTALTRPYQKLADNLKKYSASTNPNEKASLSKECDALTAGITEIEKLNSAVFQTALAARAKDFVNTTQPHLAELYKNIDKLAAKPDATPALKEHLSLQKRFLQAEELFHSKAYLDPGNAYKFQALYLLTNEKMDRNIETFCKSGEDRTGWMRVTLLALTTFKAANGRDPDFNNEMDNNNFHKNYLNAAHELSASVDNTGFNSGARGLQVDSSYTTSSKNMDFGKSMAVLAKKIYTIFNKRASAIDDAGKRMSAGSRASLRGSQVLNQSQRTSTLIGSRRGSNSSDNGSEVGSTRSSRSGSESESKAQSLPDKESGYSSFAKKFLGRSFSTDRRSKNGPEIEPAVPVTNSVPLIKKQNSNEDVATSRTSMARK